MTEMSSPDNSRNGAAGLSLADKYFSTDNPLNDFYISAFGQAKKYNRTVGCFDSETRQFSVQSILELIYNSGTMRFSKNLQLNKSYIEPLQSVKNDMGIDLILIKQHGIKLFEHRYFDSGKTDQFKFYN